MTNLDARRRLLVDTPERLANLEALVASGVLENGELTDQDLEAVGGGKESFLNRSDSRRPFADLQSFISDLQWSQVGLRKTP